MCVSLQNVSLVLFTDLFHCCPPAPFKLHFLLSQSGICCLQWASNRAKKPGPYPYLAKHVFSVVAHVSKVGAIFTQTDAESVKHTSMNPCPQVSCVPGGIHLQKKLFLLPSHLPLSGVSYSWGFVLGSESHCPREWIWSTALALVVTSSSYWFSLECGLAPIQMVAKLAVKNHCSWHCDSSLGLFPVHCQGAKCSAATESNPGHRNVLQNLSFQFKTNKQKICPLWLQR